MKDERTICITHPYASAFFETAVVLLDDDTN